MPQNDRSQPPLTRANAPTAFALRNIADRKARGRLRAAATAEAAGKGELEWTDAEGWRYQLEAPPRVTISPKDIERAAATVDLKVWDATDTLIFRDRIHAWDGFPVLVPDGTQHKETRDGTTHRVDNFRESPVEAARLDLAHTVRVVTKNGPWVKAKPGTVSTFYVDTGDGYIQSRGLGSYADARTGSNLSVTTTSSDGLPYWTDFSGPDYYIRQVHLRWDTSSVGADDVTDATLSLYFLSGENTDGWGSLYAREYDYGASLTTADWRATNGTSASDALLAQIARTSISINAYNALTSEAAFVAAINGSGYTGLYVLVSNTESATAPTGWNWPRFWVGDRAGTTEDPKLVVTHASATKPFRRALLGVGF